MKARLLLWPALVLATAGGLGVVLLQPSRPADVEALAREAVLKRLPSGAVAIFQDIRIHDYGVMGERGVCGQVEAPAGSGQRMEFAVRILLPMAANSQGRAELEFGQFYGVGRGCRGRLGGDVHHWPPPWDAAASPDESCVT